MSRRKLSLRLEALHFTYEAASAPLFEGVTLSFSPGWTGVVGANGAGKTTLLLLACGELQPQRGARYSTARRVVYCAQRTDLPPSLLGALLEAQDPLACRLRGQLGLEWCWQRRWPSLSHGERKRAQLAVALWQQPDLLAVDEPTNHIDRQAWQLLLSALQRFDGIGLLVSHDRELLDGLCQRCVFVAPPSAIARPGGYSAGAAEGRREQREVAHRRQALDRRYRNLAREAGRRRHEAHRSRSRLSKRKLARKDSDGRATIDGARLTGKDGRAGRQQRQLGRRTERLLERRNALQVTRQYTSGVRFDVAAQRSGRRLLARLPAGARPFDGGAGGAAQLELQHELQLLPGQRVGLTGPNGSGKTTLVRELLQRSTLPDERLLYLPQELTPAEAGLMLRELRQLSPEQLGRLMSLVRRLGSEPERLLRSSTPSPGELRKLLLARGLSRSPELLVLDEPTNHLDLLSIECLEQALQQQVQQQLASGGSSVALLLVSHDGPLLARLTDERWCIDRRPGARDRFTLDHR